MDMLDKAALRRRLQDLAASDVPKDLAPGAMCYAQALPPEEAEYICPVCGEKTLYGGSQPQTRLVDRLQRMLGFKSDKSPVPATPSPHVVRRGRNWASQVEWWIPHCRGLLAKCRLLGLDADLDESQFCERCKPGVADPQLILRVRYGPAGDLHPTEGVQAGDLELLVEFLRGSLRHDAGMTGEEPLKEHLARLHQLLGIPTQKD